MKISYYTSLTWWGEAEAKKVTPKGYDFEVIKLDKALPHFQISSSTIFRGSAILRGWGKDSHIHYVGDYVEWEKNRSKDEDYRGQTSRWIGSSTSYTRSFVKKNGYIYMKPNDDTANWCSKTKKGAIPQWIYTPQHENLHCKTRDLKKQDRLHEWIGLGKYDKYESEYLVKEINSLLPLLDRLAFQFYEYASAIGLDLRITSAFRSVEKQNEYWNQGRTTAGDIITNAKGGESFHNYGVAFDIVDRKKGYNLSDEEWQTLRFIWRYITYKETGHWGEWGGDWTSFIDKPHYQLTLGYSIKNFQTGNVDYSKFD